MDLNDYLSIAWFLLPCDNTCGFSLCLFRASFFLSSLGGKRESTVTGGLSTSTTVRPRCFFSTSPLNHLLTSVHLLSMPYVRGTDECVCCCVLRLDTKNTQWEDPRLQSPAITGPVSSFSSTKLWFSRPAAYLPASLYDTVQSLCRCHLTCRHFCVVCMAAPLGMR